MENIKNHWTDAIKRKEEERKKREQEKWLQKFYMPSLGEWRKFYKPKA